MTWRRVLVCGSRRWTDADIIDRVLNGILDATESLTVIEGRQRGADVMAGDWVRRAKLANQDNPYLVVDHLPFPANWTTYGNAGGPIRNQSMLSEGKPDVVIAFHDDIAGGSRGTKDMCDRASKAGVPVYVVSHYQPAKPSTDPTLFGMAGPEVDMGDYYGER